LGVAASLPMLILQMIRELRFRLHAWEPRTTTLSMDVYLESMDTMADIVTLRFGVKSRP
jgi:hypothetical protein